MGRMGGETEPTCGVWKKALQDHLKWRFFGQKVQFSVAHTLHCPSLGKHYLKGIFTCKKNYAGISATKCPFHISEWQSSVLFR